MNENDKGFEMTHGQYLVGADFNPSASSKVDKIKRTAAVFIDLIETIDPVLVGPEVSRLKALAISNAEAAAMWAVKAATKPSRK